MLNLFSRWGKKTPIPAELKRVDPLEDVQRLYNELNLDASSYQRFDTAPLPETSVISDTPTHAAPEVPTETMTPPATEEAVPHTDQTPPEQSPSGSDTSAATTEQPPAPGLQPHAAPITTPQAARTADFSLLSHFARNTLHAASVDAPVVGFASFSGGVGKSTLSAALATSLLSRNHRCLVLGQTLFSPLPYYLGWTTQEQDDELPSTVIHINQPIESVGKSLNLFIGETGSAHLVEEARKTIPRADLILYDLEASPNIVDAFKSIDLLIVPIRPDINALIIINRIEQAIANLNHPPKLGVYFVLNQYTEEKNLHQEIRQTLERRLGSRLLDVTIPWDETVQEALANGKSPQAHQSNSPFAQATDTLSRWLEQATSLPLRA